MNDNIRNLIEFGHNPEEAERIDRAEILCGSEEHEIWRESILAMMELHDYDYNI